MKIVVVGAGALGTFFGLRMREAGHEVAFLVREGREKQIKANGLKVKSARGESHWADPYIATNPEELLPCDLVFLSVKGYHLDGVMPALDTFAKSGAAIFPVLNGIEHIDKLKQVFGVDAVLGGVAYIVAALNEAGHVVHTGNQQTFIYGPLSSASDGAAQKAAKELAETGDQVNLDLIKSDEIEEEMWKKYVFISAFSGLTTASRLSIGPIRKTEATLALGKEVIEEMGALARTYRIKIEVGVEEAFEKIRTFPDESTSSMHQDFRNHRPLEVEALFGAALRMGQLKGLVLPHVETIYALLKPYEQGNGKIE